MKSVFLVAVALSVATPIMAQPAPAPAVKEAPAEPARLAAAKPVIDKLWPLGTYRRMMDGTMSKMMDAMLDTAMGMKPSDFAKMGGGTSESSIGEAVATADPHFRERMKLSMDTMMSEMIPLMEKVEPQVRESLGIIYARKYTVSQLNDMVSFFATPTGALYARESMLVFMDPEMLKGMQAFTPELIAAMPTIMKKVEAATAHLPPLPKPKDNQDEATSSAESAAAAAADAIGDADPAYDPKNWSAEDRATRETLEAEYSAAGDKFYGFSEEAATRAKAKLKAKK